MLKIVTLLWDANEQSFPFSRCYDEKWVERLYDGVARNLTVPFQFVLFTDRPRQIDRDIVQVLMSSKPDYGACIEPYRLNEPMILVGLDTVIVGNIDHLAEYCLTANMIAVPHDPYHFPKVCNGVALVPAGQRRIYDDWNGENDMEWIRQQPYKVLDLLFRGQIVSYKAHAKNYGLRDARIVYFHGHEKPHECLHLPWIRQHWLGLSDEPDETPIGQMGSVIVEACCNTPNEMLFANIKANSLRDVPWLNSRPAHDGHAVMVGGGPSLKGSLDDIRARKAHGQTIFALNNAANFLLENGIVADYQLVLDARADNVRFVVSWPAKKYLIGSQCHPSLFDALEGADVTLFHWAMDGIVDHLPSGRLTTLLAGGYVLGPIAMSAACALGYRNLHLYGYDSSDADDGRAHAYDQCETDPEKRRLEVVVGERKFRCSYGMYKQAEHFPQFAQTLADNGCTITVHGDGLLPAIAHQMMQQAQAQEINHGAAR